MSKLANAPKGGYRNYSVNALRDKTKHMTREQRRQYGLSLLNDPNTTEATKNNWRKLWKGEPEYFKDRSQTDSRGRKGKSKYKYDPSTRDRSGPEWDFVTSRKKVFVFTDREVDSLVKEAYYEGRTDGTKDYEGYPFLDITGKKPRFNVDKKA